MANRCPLGNAQVVIQQLMNLCNVKGHDPCRFSATISCLRGRNDAAPQFLHVLKSWIVFETSALGDLVKVDYDLGVETPIYRPLPESVTRHIRGLGEDGRAYDRWGELLEMIASFCERGGYMAPEYAAFLEQRTDDFGEWLSFLLPHDGVQHLPAVSQRLLVKMASGPETPQAESNLPQFYSFAQVMAPRLHVSHGPYLALFEKEFIR